MPTNKITVAVETQILTTPARHLYEGDIVIHEGQALQVVDAWFPSDDPLTVKVSFAGISSIATFQRKESLTVVRAVVTTTNG